ncbi:oligomeric golgi complex component, COG2-domain-containing protein [Pseudoneurospora amorphoporcata]|uniref:Conserved oligomeric Golgi complex subunit 2 n=1 Tax=Pseudoneurospora amorphoporcata TaxID=241081 RepID=A0AAN6NQN0_9PEZI|nr:oligomeric golgi complex component, COG2-domain-containing protein [Pseudoneurospora amorphoporcata]
MATLNTPNFAAPSSHGPSSPQPRSQTSSPISPKSTTPLPTITTNLNNNPPLTNDDSPSPEDDDDNDNNISDLPFPTALPRPSFLTPQFSPLSYLDSLYSSSSSVDSSSVDPSSSPRLLGGQRHQTLPDLRSELHTRSLSISSELLELVNANYTSFLSLGDELKGGEDRVEDIRVAVLGFRRAVEEVRAKVKEKRAEVGLLCGELGNVRAAVEWARGVLELEGRVEGLEIKLSLAASTASTGGTGTTGTGGGAGAGAGAGVQGWVKRGMTGHGQDVVGLGEEEDDYAGWDSGSEDFKEKVLLDNDSNTQEDDQEEGGFMSGSPAELEALAKEYVGIEQMADRLGGHEVPFVRKMEERMIRCRNTILLDLSTALKEARRAGEKGKKRVLRYMGVYRLLDAEQEAVRVLKEK